MRRGRLELLLVRTKGGHGWTFPKGHIEDGETAYQAAEREAREEAGVAGRVERRRLTTYSYGARPREKGVSVCAFLLEVTGRAGETERGRKPRWCPVDEARLLLAVGRAEEFAAEHARVVSRVLPRVSAAERG